MQQIDWRTRSAGEVISWCRQRHYQAELHCFSPDGAKIDYRSRIISDGIVSLGQTHCIGGLKLRRGWDHIRRDENKKFTVYYPLRRELRFMQNGQEQAALPGEFIIMRGDNPLRMESLGDADDPFEMLYVSVPAHMLRALLSEADRFCGRKITLGDGLGRVSRDLLARDVFAAMPSDPILTERLLMKTVELALEAISQSIRSQAGDDLAPIDLQQAHLDRLMAYVRSNLGSKSLSVASAAEACGISKRYLHMIMARTGTSFSNVLWTERLKQAKEWLYADEHRHLTIEQIASFAGFSSSSHFSRVFKSRFGAAPRAVREAGRSAAVTL